jgi:hypothetical protein
MSLSFGSLASTAVSTFKGLAVAAAGTEGQPAAEGVATRVGSAPAAAEGVATRVGSAPAAAEGAASAPAAPAPVVVAPAERSEPKAVKRRLGSVLDAYA